MAAAAIAGGIFGAVTSYFSIKEKNKALRAEADFNLQKDRMTQNLSNFAQSNNIQRANEISAQIAAETTEAGRDITTEERSAVGKETIRRGEGITAGSSVVRSVDNIIQQGNKAKAKLQSSSEQAFIQVQTQAKEANIQEQNKKIDSHNNTLIANASLAAKQVTGINALLQIAGSTMQGVQAGASFGSSLGGK